MARRIGSVDEFEFKAIGENQNQGVSIASSFNFCRICIDFIYLFICFHLQSIPRRSLLPHKPALPFKSKICLINCFKFNRHLTFSSAASSRNLDLWSGF